MAELNSYMDLLKILPKTNCRECGCPTCMVFAIQVFQDQKDINACTQLDSETLKGIHITVVTEEEADDTQKNVQAELKEKIKNLDFDEAANRINGVHKNGKLSIRIMGKDFQVDHNGNLYSAIHVNNWIANPFMDYAIRAKGTKPTGNWMQMRDLKGGDDWYLLFNQRCEKPFKKLIDKHIDLMEYILDIFDGEKAPGSFNADIAIILRPFPLIPLMICYFKEEDGMDSNLSLFFDETVTENIAIEMVYSLFVGLLTMFEKIVQTHD